MNALQDVFTTVLNMSITASYAAAGVTLVRFALRKAPKIFSYALWAVVLFRLICPFSFPSAFSLLGLLNLEAQNGAGVVEYVPAEIDILQAPTIQSGIDSVDSVVNASLPQAVPVASANPMQMWIAALSLVWLAGIFALLAYSVVSYIKLKRRLQTATLVRGNIYESDRIDTAFVLGFIRPKIYVPVDVGGADLSYIMEHERTHIRRRDYLIKPLAFLALILHWFNPLMWLSFVLMNRDMEMSCDESVLRRMGGEAKSGYSCSLLSLSVKRTGLLTANPLAFGESHVKARIKNVLSYKKPAFWIILIATVAVAAALLAFAANPKEPFNLGKTEAEAMLFSTGETDLLKIGEAAFDHYYSSFMGKEIPGEYRITEYKLNDISLLAGDEKEFCVAVNYDHTTSGLYFLSANGGSKLLEDGSYAWLDSYGEFRVKSLGNNEYQIVGIGTGGGAQGLAPVDQTDSNSSFDGAGDSIKEIVENNLNTIMSSPKESSNPQDYIDAHQGEFESILKLGGEEALSYMLSQFESGNAEGLRGQIMMRLCKELLGARNNVTGETLSPQEWYAALSVRQEIRLPDFAFDGSDPIEKLVYTTETEKSSQPERGFTVVAPKIFGSYKEGGWLRVFVTTYSATYRLYGNVLDEVGGSIVPAAITYKNDGSGNYTLSDYEQAKDGSDFAPSIREFCAMPVSGKEIPGLAGEILEHYGDYEDIRILQRQNLFIHLRANRITDATLVNSRGEIEFSMSSPQYMP